MRKSIETGRYSLSEHLVIIENNSKTWAYNSLFGGLRELSDKEIDVLIKLRENNYCYMKSDKETLAKLLADKFVYDSEYDEYLNLQLIKEKYKISILNGDSITKLLLNVTSDCNLRCQYCYLNNVEEICGHIEKKNMTWSTAKKAIDAFYNIIQKGDNKKVHVRFHGGEPLIQYKLIRQCIEYINNKSENVEVRYHMNTNGVLMNQEMAEFFANQNMNIEVSIDAQKEIHDNLRPFASGKGSFDEGTNAIRLLLENKMPEENLNIATTLTENNVAHLKEIVDLCLSLGLKNLEINTLLFRSKFDVIDIEKRVNALIDVRSYGLRKGVRVTGKWFKLIERLKDTVLNYCGRFGQQISVDSDEGVYVCTGYLHKYTQLDTIDDLFKDEEYFAVAMRGIGNIEGCKDCMIEGACAGGCTAAVIAENGTFDVPKYKECEFRKLMAKKLIENMDRIICEEINFEEIDKTYVPIVNN